MFHLFNGVFVLLLLDVKIVIKLFSVNIFLWFFKLVYDLTHALPLRKYPLND